MLVNSCMTFSSAFNIEMGGGGVGDLNSKFLQNTKCVKSFIRDCLKGLKLKGA